MALENEWVENDIKSLCTKSIGFVACKALPLEKDSNVVCQERNLEKLDKCKILWEDQKQNSVCSSVENFYSSDVQIFHVIAYSKNECVLWMRNLKKSQNHKTYIIENFE